MSTSQQTPGAAANSPRVSFIVPCYKLAHLLPECVASILGQTHQNLEILIMDDCSPDNTAEVARSFTDSRVRYIRNEPNLGHLRNYNKGIGLATGEYIWLISADDLLRKPYVVARYVEVMEANPRTGFAFCTGMGLRDGQETEIVGWADLHRPDAVLEGRGFLRRLLDSNCVLAPAGMVRRACYEHLGMFPTDLPFAGDWYLWCIFSLFYDAAYFAEPMVNYREHSLSMTDTLIGKDIRLLARDDQEVRWRILASIEEVGDAALAEHCRATIAEYYCGALTSKKWRGGSYRMTLAEFDASLAAHISDPAVAERLRQSVLSHVGKDLYWDPRFAPDLDLYRAALRHGPPNRSLWLKYSLLRLGAPGRAALSALSWARGRARSLHRDAPATGPGVAAAAATERPSVAFITENQNFGGMEVHTLGLIGAFIGRGFDIELVQNRYKGYDALIAARGWSGRVRILHTDLSGILYGDETDEEGWRRALAPLRSRILVFPKGNNNFGQVRLLKLCREKFERVVLIEHLEAPARPRGGKRWLGVLPGLGLWWRRRRRSSRAGARCADRIVAVSAQVRRRLLEDFGYPAEQVVVVRNGVAWRVLKREAASGADFRAAHAIGANDFVFGMLTRLSPEKAVDLALRALARVLASSPARTPILVIAGQGPLRGELEALAQELGITGNVRFIGFVAAPAAILPAYDSILFSSNLEGLPLGLLEGMAAGCVPIVTRISGMPEAVDSAAVGWVVAPGDSDALAAAMGAALTLPGPELEAMRVRVATRIREHFDIETCYRRIMDLCVEESTP